MKTVLKIFGSDVRSLSRRLFASAVIVAVAFLPALYAWVNIYANGNPYANTGNISIALASNDPGITLDDGTYMNLADEVFEEQKKSDKIDWQFPDTADEAIEGVRSGKYYAAVIFEENFTYNMYHFEQALLDKKAPLTYYENGKKNAVAAKITETAAGNLQESIKTRYLETVFSQVFGETNDAAGRINSDEAADAVIAQLESLRDTLNDYNDAIDSFTINTADTQAGIAKAGSKLAATRKKTAASAAKANADLQKARASVNALEATVKIRQQKLVKEIDDLKKAIEKLKSIGPSDEQKAALEQDAREKADTLKADLEDFAALLPGRHASAAVLAVKAALESMIATVDNIHNTIEDYKTAAQMLVTLEKENLASLDKSLDAMIKTMNATLDQLEPLASSMSLMLDDLDPVLDSASDTIGALDASLKQMQTVFKSAADNIDNIIKKVNAVNGDERLAMLVKLLGGDPEQYAAFFSSLVVVEIAEVYNVASYGAAMAPFYSVLAIWVGGVILVSILQTHVDRKKYPGINEPQAFCGRFILFWLIGQVQASVIVAGDIFLLGCAPIHPWLMWFSAEVTSFVFVLLIYALTISFGDIGKAMVVVVMVLQIAGSSGSYPIEILPPVFGKLYKFFPFPYAINAMREALCGTYKSDYFIYLAELLVFAGIGLAIGLLVRKPFIGMNEFVSEKIEETEVL